MRRLALVVTLLAGCGGGADTSAAGKSWQPVENMVQDHLFGGTDDAEGRVYAIGQTTKHVFRLDPDTLMFSDLGPAPQDGALRYSDGGVYLIGAGGVHRLDNDAWTQLSTDAVVSQQLVVGPGDIAYDADTATTPGTTIITRHSLTAWANAETVATLTGAYGISVDVRGHLLGNSQDNTSISGTIDNGAFTPFYSCGTIQGPWCETSPADPQVNASGELTFFMINDIRGSRFLRMTGAADPADAAPMPTPAHGNAYHVFSEGTVLGGTRYLAFGGNDLDSPHFYELPPGGSAFIERAQLPDDVFGFQASLHGTLYCSNNINMWVLK